MKIIKLLNKKILSILIIFILFLSSNTNAEDEPADIWDLEKKVEENNSNTISESIEGSEINIQIEDNSSANKINIIESNELKDNKIDIVGLYDPEENGLKIDMWSYSNGDQLKNLFSNLDKIDLSQDAAEIMKISLPGCL